MKIKTRKVSTEYALSIKKPKHERPQKPWFILTALIRLLAIPDMISTKFRYTTEGMEKAGKGPYLILMNHSSFIDLKIASKIFFPHKYCIVCTSDGFIGKKWLMKKLGCISTQKFVTDISLITDMLHVIKKKRTSILMYPEASYSFDGCATPLPRKLGTLIKKLNVPVLTVITEGAFLREPLYNCLQKRKTKVSAKLTCLLSKEEIKEKSVEEIDKLLDDTFSFDNFKTQYETKTKITENFRADGLHRILFRCANCNSENTLNGSGTTLTCNSCKKTYELTTLGQIKALNGNTEFSHIPDWYNWQRSEIIKEIKSEEYNLNVPVEIGIMADYNAIYMVGNGTLKHDNTGFTLTSDDGKLNYVQPPQACYGLYADYYWYEISDVICIGNKERLYYCFPKTNTPVAKARIATEELYKIYKSRN